MKLHFLFLFLGGLLLGGAQPVRASHVLGGQLTYTYLNTAATGEQNYRVRALLMVDCGALGISPSITMSAVNACGGVARTATLLPVGQPVFGAPYCPSTQATVPCNSLTTGISSNQNHITATYEGTIALPPAAEWVLAVEESTRPAMANLAAPGTLRLEARLHSLLTPVSGGPPVVVTNSSPTFAANDPLVTYATERQPQRVSFGGLDTDRTNGRADSLSYSLEQPLTGCGTYETYAPYPPITNPAAASCVTRIDPHCTNRIIQCSSLGYSTVQPIVVVNDTIFENGSHVRPPCNYGSVTVANVRPRFLFNPRQASFTFTPGGHIPNVLLTTGLNRYVVVGKVTEYRKINGHYYVVGSTRRDMVVVVVPFSGNVAAGVPASSLSAGSNATMRVVGDTLEATVTTGNYTHLQLNFSDPDNASPNPLIPLQNLTVSYPADLNTSLLRGGDIGTFVLAGNGTATPVATFHLQPSAAAAGQSVFIALRVKDNACPMPIIQHLVVHLRFAELPQLPRIAVAGQGGGAVAAATACFASPVQLLSRISRPDSVRNAATGQVVAQQYRYLWGSTNPNPATNGLPAALNTRDLLVQPTVDTRYTLRMSPVLGFAPGQFVDTTSIVLRGGSPPSSSLPAPVITRSGNVLSSNYAAGNQWYRDGIALPGATGQTYLLTATGSYTLVVQPDPTQCTFPPTAPLLITALGSAAARAGTSLRVAPNPTADGRLRVELGGYQHTATLAVYDLLGRQVLAPLTLEPSPAGAVRELDLSAQPAGVYLLQVRTKGGLDVRRVVRQ